MFTTRRDFLATTGTAALVSLAPAVPQFLLRAADEAPQRGENVLVVVQLSGGNDGLNTVVPYKDEIYRRSRPVLGIPAAQVLKIDEHFGFHPALTGFAKLLEDRRLAIVQGVGYPNPNRSHFESMDIWHSARMKADSRNTGWLGRYLDARQAGRGGGDLAAVHFGEEVQPLALSAEETPIASVRSLSRFGLETDDASLRRAIDATVAIPRPSSNELLQFVQASTLTALSTSRRMADAIQRRSTATKYPTSDLAKKLETTAQLIDAGFTTRIYYVALNGFDTHATQAVAHAGLLTQLGDAIKAFYDDLTERGHADRVLLMCFSEFGRRVQENASLGTDHGAAAPLFLVGGRVRPGLLGRHPSLTDLDDGDLKHHTDFRQVYAGVLENWLGTPSEKILGSRFQPLDFTT